MQKGIITGCYEAEPRYFDNAQEALKHPSASWTLLKCESLSRKRFLGIRGCLTLSVWLGFEVHASLGHEALRAS